jgi:hypothetical protein
MVGQKKLAVTVVYRKMRLSDFFGPMFKFILAIGGLVFRFVCLLSGLKKERKSFIWLNGFGSYIKNPTFNIIYGIFLIIIFLLAVVRYGAKL